MLKKELIELFNVDEIEIISNRDESSVGTHKINIYLEDEIYL